MQVNNNEQMAPQICNPMTNTSRIRSFDRNLFNCITVIGLYYYLHMVLDVRSRGVQEGIKG